MLLVEVAGVLTSSIFVINLILQRPLLESLLFSLAIAVGITPQLLPAVVTTSSRPGRVAWPAWACWSSGSCASRISGTSRSC